MDFNCKFYDEDTICQEFYNSKGSLILNCNIQSLSKKIDALRSSIYLLNNKNVSFDVISLQEIWCSTNMPKFDINGFQPLIYKTRKFGRGGGVGFFVRNGIKFKVIDELSFYIEKIFESLCIDLEYPSGKKTKLVSLYRLVNQI